MLRSALPIALFAVAVCTWIAPAASQEASEKSESPSIGSWLNTPPDRQAVAFDRNNNRLYFDEAGKVVGRYNRELKKFQAGIFYVAQWHNIGHNIAASDNPSTPRKTTSPTTPSTTAADESVAAEPMNKSTAAPTPYPIVPFPRNVVPPAEPEPAKAAEVYRRGQTSGGSARRTRAKVIEVLKP